MKYVGMIHLWNREHWHFIRYPREWARFKQQFDFLSKGRRFRRWTLTIAGFTWFFDDVRDAP